MRDNRGAILVLSVATNFYDKIYSRCIESHRFYSLKNDYSYLLVKKPYITNFMESAWLKIPLLLSALEAGYSWVLFVDADCEIRSHTPEITTLEREGKYIYMGKGFSGRLNSGVIIVKNSEFSIRFFREALLLSSETVPETDLGENGHVIHLCKKHSDFIEVICQKWNNNADIGLQDYIRHYSSGGVMRNQYNFLLHEKVYGLCLAMLNMVMKVSGIKYTKQYKMYDILIKNKAACEKIYTALK